MFICHRMVQTNAVARKVVLLAMVVGLGFAWIENVEYGVRTYEQMQNTQVLMDVTKADITVVCDDPQHPRDCGAERMVEHADRG